MLLSIGALALFLAAMGYSWARDPTVRVRAEHRGRRLAPPASEIQAEMDSGTYSPSKLMVQIEAVALVKARKAMLVVGAVSLLIGAGGLLLRSVG